MFNISNKHEEFFDYLVNNAEIFHKEALLAQGAMKDPTMLHLPVSTTHVVSGSIMGVGSAQRIKAVHWDVARSMVTAWVMTIPCTAVMGAISYLVATTIFGGGL